MTTKTEKRPRAKPVSLAIRQVRVEHMFIDYAVDGGYQRAKHEERAIDIAENFEPNRFEPIHVSKRADGRYAVVEGQTRYWVAVLRGMPSLQSIVHDNMTRAQEAQLFIDINGPGRQAAPAYDRYFARLAAGDPFTQSLDALVRSAEWRVQQGTATGRVIRAVTSLEAAFRQHGPESVRSALWLLEPWTEDNKISGSMLHGMTDFVAYYGDKIDLKRVRVKLEKVPAASIERRAKGKYGGGAGAFHTFIMHEILAEWNKGRRKTGHLEALADVREEVA